MNQELIESPPSAGGLTFDEPLENVQLIASSQQEMQLAQTKLAEWFVSKKSKCEHELAEAKENLSLAVKSGILKTGSFSRVVRRAQKRVEFYDKCRMAVEAGYTLCPAFPVDVFAIRTNKSGPQKQTRKWRGSDRSQSSEGCKAGDGRWVDSQAIEFTEEERIETDGKFKTTNYYWSEAFDEEVEFPMIVAKPEIINRTNAAMAAKVFDELGVLPARRSKGDPLVVGMIRRPITGSTSYLYFLLSWYIDTAEL